MKHNKNTYINALMWYCGISKSKANQEYNKLKYDIIKLKVDCLQMPITDAQTISFFFINQLFVLLESIQSSLLHNMEEIPETQQLMDQFKDLDLPSSILSQFC